MTRGCAVPLASLRTSARSIWSTSVPVKGPSSSKPTLTPRRKRVAIRVFSARFHNLVSRFPHQPFPPTGSDGLSIGGENHNETIESVSNSKVAVLVPVATSHSLIPWVGGPRIRKKGLATSPVARTVPSGEKARTLTKFLCSTESGGIWFPLPCPKASAIPLPCPEAIFVPSGEKAKCGPPPCTHSIPGWRYWLPSPGPIA